MEQETSRDSNIKLSQERKEVLESLRSLLYAVQNINQPVDQKIIQNYHEDLERAEKCFGDDLKKFKVIKNDIDGIVDIDRPIQGFLEGVDSTSTFNIDYFQEEYYNKILFVKKLIALIYYLEKNFKKL